MAVNTISIQDLIKEARATPIFDGRDAYTLRSFINDVETLTSMVNEEGSKAYLYRIFLSKIQGPAAASIRRIQENNWVKVKQQLKLSFGISTSYLHLKEEADQVSSKNVSQLYYSLSKILDKLNLKFELDEEQPTEFKPQNNELSILEKFLNKLNRVDSMFLRTKNVKSLEEAYQTLVETGISFPEPRIQNLSSFENKTKSYKNQNKNWQNNFCRNQSTNQNNYNKNYNNYYKNHNSGNFPNKNFIGNRNNQNCSQNTRNFRHGNPSGNFNNSNRENFNQPLPMDVDHNSEVTENFLLDPPVRHYP